MTSSVGRQFADAVARRDTTALEELLHPGVDFKGLTPGRFWEAADAAGVIDIVLGSWFEESDQVEAVAAVEDGPPVSDTRRVGYRFEVTNGDGAHVVEQQVYYREQDGAITYMRAVCSGFRRAD